ncbi:MAG: hypothetical protein FRX49_08537 [Trebouxia sp. A1-2]|nr:MAG: hypothetical protein FRX49_08537 [Trebouxia sp. A1-2]
MSERQLMSVGRAVKYTPCKLPTMPELPECTVSAQSSLDLVQLANTSKFKYLDHLPKQLLNNVDVALVVESLVLPAHSVIVMAASTVFNEILAAQIIMTDSGVNTPRSSALEVMMVGENWRCVQTALEYIYKRCSLSKGYPPKDVRISTTSEAKHLVKFGRKYNVEVLLDESDAFMCKWLKTNFEILECSNGSKGSAVANACAEERAAIVVEWAVIAEGKSLFCSLAYCESWIVRNFIRFPGAHNELCRLSKESMLRIMKDLPGLCCHNC